MNNIKRVISLILVCALFLGGNIISTQAASATFPTETNPFEVPVHYVSPTDQSSPFFDTILPEIRKNIKENNTHSINRYYDNTKYFPLRNNPENFQGRGHSTYANINGKTVTAEAFHRVYNNSVNDPNCGMGLLIYQCIEYKRAHPEEDVKITFSSYRTSVTAAVCVIPESKYYGYMRSLFGVDYDEHGFVRISFMLTEAARMGIEVTLVHQLNSYGVYQQDPTAEYDPANGKYGNKYKSHLDHVTYFKRAMATDCYNTYEPGKKVSDFMNSCTVEWTVQQIGANMQHVKSASASHYLATDGTEHTNAIFFSSSNLDENNYRGANGNNSSQSGVIVSDHEELYKCLYNYTQLMVEYKSQEGIYEFRKIVNEMNNKQIELIMSGKGDQIPDDEQIVYLGTENDPVFELYFTPLGGSADAWDTLTNPFCKYISKLPESTDYVEFYWNEFGYGESNMGSTMTQLLEKAFCEKPNVNNKFYISVDGFDSSEIEKLNLGTEIGFRTIKTGSGIHTKDILLSYEEEGVRHKVSIMSSANYYMIAFSYRTNSMLVIHETDETGGSFYDIYSEAYTDGMVNNDLSVSPGTLMLEPGESHKPIVTYAGTGKLTWSSDKTAVATVDANGVITATGIGSATITVTDGKLKDTLKVTVVECADCYNANGLKCNINEQYILSKKYTTTPMTFEAVFSVDIEDLTGTTTLLGSDGMYEPALVFSLNKNGNPRVAIRDKAWEKNEEGKFKENQSVYVFNNVNVATGETVHLSFTIDLPNKKINCYVNGELVQSGNLKTFEPFEEKHNAVVGGDHRNGNATYFKGTIESIAVWSDVRTAEEIAADYKNGITTADDKILAAYDFTKCKSCMTSDLSVNGNDLKHVVLWQDIEDVEPVIDYEYSFAVIGDTQTMCETDPEAMEDIYDWILENKEEHKIEYVIGLGDITDDSTDKEWAYAKEYISKLNGKIPYVLCRGNHDDLDDFNQGFSEGYFENKGMSTQVTGDYTNSYRYLNIQGTDYLIMTLDFAPNSAVLSYVNKVIEQHPDHKVIILTHAYMYRDGTTIDSGDLYPPTYYEGYSDAQNGDDMWEKSFSKHENVLMVLSGHDPWQHIVYRQDEGEKGNLVTQMLIDPQYMDKYIGSTGMVAMFYFSNDGNTLTVRYYSVAKECFGSALSQFTIDLTNK